jgi:hypothetical protein
MRTTSTARSLSLHSGSEAAADRAFADWTAEVLAFRAPYLEEKLVKDQIAAGREEADALFQEVKKYLILVHMDPSRGYSVYSHRIDAVWHEFVLFTDQYARFSARYFHTFMHHDPANAPKDEPASSGTVRAGVTYEEFCELYERRFATPLPDLWRDGLSVTLDARLRNEHVASNSVRLHGGKAELLLDDETVLARVDMWGEDALRFIATHRSFFARELPGSLAADDRLALCRALVRSRALRVAP